MPRRKHSVLSQNTAHKKTMQFKVDPKIGEELEALDERLARENPDKLLDRHEVVETALRQAIAEANRELDALKRTGGATQHGPDQEP
jgi:hypothetical protein